MKEKLLKERATLIIYLLSKVETNFDWHAVADAAMDLRDIDAKLELLEDLEKDKLVTSPQGK